MNASLAREECAKNILRGMKRAKGKLRHAEPFGVVNCMPEINGL